MKSLEGQEGFSLNCENVKEHDFHIKCKMFYQKNRSGRGNHQVSRRMRAEISSVLIFIHVQLSFFLLYLKYSRQTKTHNLHIRANRPCKAKHDGFNFNGQDELRCFYQCCIVALHMPVLKRHIKCCTFFGV